MFTLAVALLTQTRVYRTVARRYSLTRIYTVATHSPMRMPSLPRNIAPTQFGHAPHYLDRSHPSICRRRCGTGDVVGGLRRLRRHGLAKALARLNARLARGKGRQPQEALATGAEASAGDGDDLGLLENLREHVPRRLALEVHKDVRRIVATVHLEVDVEHRLLEHRRILHVVVDQDTNLLEALRIERGERALLHNVGRAVEGCAHDAVVVGRDR
mmetsp:Transcript_40316/g.106810  ORF Transcript_40316/g.106810 Transcript_40316/m.106810 type:complete len:215 (+) Transcript_40316:41-685(+)